MEPKKILMVIAPKEFRDEELLDPKKVFEDNGYKVEIASRDAEPATGKLGVTVGIDIDISHVNVRDYEAIVFVGGAGAHIYFQDRTAMDLARDAHNSGKVVGAICIAPSILANAGLLETRKATCFPSQKENLIARGALYTGGKVTVDGKVVTANGPEAATEFGEKIVELLVK